jgi:hypothetical protein
MITEVTRRNIFDAIRLQKLNWAGRLDETEFLARIFDLDSMPSYDSRFKSATRDIWQHRINNPDDWEDDWIFSDKRFNLLRCDDAIFLQFLCEMLHPIVRDNKEEIEQLQKTFNEYLSVDNYEIYQSAFISGYPVYSGRQKKEVKPLSSKKPCLEIFPQRGPLGTHFEVRGNGFEQDEEVIVWYITPSGIEARFSPTYKPNNEGTFRFTPYSSSSPTFMEIGQWWLYAKGNISGKVGLVSFIVESTLQLSRSLRVFLCHASQDKPSVRKLYMQLKTSGIDPWLDEEKLIPGQNWRLEIPKAVRSSDVIVVCLSGNSISKEGFVQSEIKLALDIATEKPEGAIFLIPLKIEECEVPDSLRHLQWVNYFAYKGFERLLYALRARAENLGLIGDGI